MSRHDPYYDAHPRNVSPQRRRTSPHDARRGPESSSQIRGFASGGGRAGRDSYDKDAAPHDDYRRHRRPEYEQHSRYTGGNERDIYDDRYDGGHAHDRRSGSGSQSPRPHRQRGNFDDRDDYRSSQRDDRAGAPDHRDRSHGSRPDGGYRDGQAPHQSTPRDRPRGEPSREIMLEGLSQDITEEHVKTELQQYFQVRDLESLRIIRNRDTGLTRGFGFLRFPSVEAATVFMDQNYPFIHLYGDKAGDKDAEGTKISIVFSKERERDVRAPEIREGDWICANCITHNFSKRVECIKCGNPKSDLHTSKSNQLTQRLQPQSFNNGSVDVAPDGAPSHFLIFRNLEPKVTEEMLAKGASKLLKSDEADGAANRKIVSTSMAAQAGANKGTILRVLLVRDRRSNYSWCFGFVEFVAVDAAQAALVKYKTLEVFTIASKPVLVDYIHAGVFVPVLLGLVPGQEHMYFTASNNPSLLLAYRDNKAYVTELKVSEAKTDNQAKSEIGKSANNNEQTKTKKRKAENGTDKSSKKILQLPPSLQTWTKRQAELHGAPSSDFKDNGKTIEDSPAPVESASSSTTVSQQSYADPEKLCCWLCRTKFSSLEDIYKHESLSKAHLANLDNAATVAAATAKLVERAIPLVTDRSRVTEGYRDRAKERRDASKQPKQLERQQSDTTGSPSPPPAAGPTKGAALLGKMGWTAGQGLGAQGTGTTSAIAPDLYAAGVGLGAEGGKVGNAAEEAGRNTRGEGSVIRFQMKERARK